MHKEVVRKFQGELATEQLEPVMNMLLRVTAPLHDRVLELASLAMQHTAAAEAAEAEAEEDAVETPQPADGKADGAEAQAGAGHGDGAREERNS